MKNVPLDNDTPRVVIVGAGYVPSSYCAKEHNCFIQHNSISGVTMAVNLRHKLRHDNFVVSQFHIMWKTSLDLSRFMNKRGPSVGRGEYVIQLQSVQN